MCKLDLKDSPFSVPLNPEISAVSSVNEALRVSMPLFWTRASTKNFYRITQNSSIRFAALDRTNYGLLERNIVDRPYNRRNVNGQRDSNLPFSRTRACTEFKGSVLTPTQRIEFLGVTVDSLIMTLSLPEKNVSKVQKQCQGILQKRQVWILELTKLIGLLFSTI